MDELPYEIWCKPRKDKGRFVPLDIKIVIDLPVRSEQIISAVTKATGAKVWNVSRQRVNYRVESNTMTYELRLSY